MAKNTVIAKSKQEFSLSLTDLKDIPVGIDIVTQRLKELQGEDNTEARIEAPLMNFGIIREINDAEALIHAYSYITSKAERYNQFAPHFKEISKVKVPPFKEKGFSLEAWTKEIELQYRKVVNQKEIDKFTKYRDVMMELLSEEDKKKQKVKELAALIAEDSED